jgi:hypothetical protein
MRKLLALITLLLLGMLSLAPHTVLAGPEVKAEFDVDFSAFVDIDSFSTVNVEPGNNEVGLQSDVIVRVLDRNGNPLPGHTIHLYIEEADGTVLFVQPEASDADGYARGKVRSLSEGAFVIRAYDSTYGENVVLADSDTFYAFPVPTPQLEAEPYYTKGNSNKLFWEEIDGFDTYEYYLQAATDSQFNQITAASGWVSSLAYEFNSLDGGQIYFYRVKARNSSELESGWSNVRFSVQDDQAPVIKVEDVSLQKDGGSITGIVIELSITDDLALGSVEIFCMREDGDLEQCGVLEHDGQSYTASIPVGDLERDSLLELYEKYTFCVTADDEAGNTSSNCDIEITIDESIQTPIPFITNLINSIIDWLNDLIDDIEALVKGFLDSTQLWVLEVLSLILLILVGVVSVTLLTGSLLLVPAYVSSRLYDYFKFIGVKPHGRPTGFVYDVITKNPVKWAYVEIYDGNNRLVWRDFTNPEGEFMADLAPGKYRVSVKTPRYLFPSQLVKPREDRKLGKIYKGEYVMSTKKNPLTLALPMDPVNMRVAEELSMWNTKKMGLLKSLNVLVVVLGLALAMYLVGRSPSPLNILVLLLYIPAVWIYLRGVFKLRLGIR